MYEEAQDPTFWENVPDFMWAEHLWWCFKLLPVNRSEPPFAIEALSIPNRMHQYLIELWTLDPLAMREYPHYRRRGSYSNWAVWKLANYQYGIDLILSEIIPIEQAKNNLSWLFSSEGKEDNLDINIIGLDREIQQIAIDLVKIFHDILKFLSNKQTKENLVIHFSLLKSYLIKPGLSSLMACRCAVSLLNCFIRSEIDILQLPDKWWNIFEDIQIFYIHLHNEHKDLYLDKDREALIELLIKLHTPNNIRLNTDGDIANIADLIVETFCSTESHPFNWLRGTTLMTNTIVHLFDKNENKEYELLQALGSMNFISLHLEKSLSTQQIQKILNIVDKTDDPQILSGALFALSTSNFLNLASPDLVLKLLRSDYNQKFLSISFSSSLFRTQSYRSFALSDQNIDENMIEFIAKEVLASPHDYPFRVVCNAATYLTEHTNLNLPPILHVEQELGLYITHD